MTILNEELDQAVGPGGKYVAIIAEKTSDGKFRIPMLVKNAAGETILTPENPGTVKLSGSLGQLNTLLDAKTAADNGNTFEAVSENKSLIIECFGTATALSVIPELSVKDSNRWYVAEVMNEAKPSQGLLASITAFGIYAVDVPAGCVFRTRLASATGGNVSTTAREVK
jgi:hypothetical protein